MRLVIQRVTNGSVIIDSQTVGNIDHGLVVLVGFHKDDTSVDLEMVAQKLVAMRIFSNAAGRFDLSVADVAGGILLVPQFTLFGDTRKGRRPDFFSAMPPKEAEPKFLAFTEAVSSFHPEVAQGIFGANMQVTLTNDGPVTIIYDSPKTS